MKTLPGKVVQESLWCTCMCTISPLHWNLHANDLGNGKSPMKIFHGPLTDIDKEVTQNCYTIILLDKLKIVFFSGFRKDLIWTLSQQ